MPGPTVGWHDKTNDLEEQFPCTYEKWPSPC